MPKNHRRVLWAPRAKQDLREAWEYYERVASVEIADKLLREIDEAGKRLADDALMWKARDEVMLGLRSVLAHPYTIFYRVTNGVVEIARVLHGRRNFAAAFPKEERRPPVGGPPGEAVPPHTTWTPATSESSFPVYHVHSLTLLNAA